MKRAVDVIFVMVVITEHHLQNTQEVKGICKNKKHEEMIIPEWLLKENHGKKPRKLYDTNLLKQLAREIIRIGVNKLNEEVAAKMINPKFLLIERYKKDLKLH